MNASTFYMIDQCYFSSTHTCLMCNLFNKKCLYRRLYLSYKYVCLCPYNHSEYRTVYTTVKKTRCRKEGTDINTCQYTFHWDLIVIPSLVLLNPIRKQCCYLDFGNRNVKFLCKKKPYSITYSVL